MNRICHVVLVSIALASVALVAGVPAQSSGVTPQRGWRNVRTDLQVKIDPKAARIDVSGVLRLRLVGADRSPGPTIGINGRDRLMRYLAVEVAGSEVEINLRHPVKPHISLAQVRLPTMAQRGDEVEIEFHCERVGDGRQLVVAPTVALASWVEAWYPIPVPDRGQSMAAAARATGRTTFDLPAGWSAVSNGQLVSRQAVGDRVVDVWENEQPLARSFVAGPYQVTEAVVDGFAAAVYSLPNGAPRPDRDRRDRAHVRALAGALRAMEAHLGPYPYPSYAIAEVPADVGQFGASSEQGFIMVKPHFLRVGGGNLPLFAHEAAHGWWGNTVGTDGPGSLFCSESLAQYGAVMAIESMEGEAAATEFLRFSRAGYLMEQCARGYFRLVRSGQDQALATLVSGGSVAHTLSDAKGHWVLHMLRRRVGDARFFATLRQLLARFGGKTMTLAALRGAFVTAAPQADLEVFFEQWLERTGAPVLQADFEVIEDGVELTIRQHQPGAPYRLRLEVLLRLADGGEALHTVDLRESEQQFRVQTEGRVLGVVVDPHHRLLLWHPQYGAPPPGVDLKAPAMSADQLAIYTGEYTVPAANITVEVFERGRQLMVRVASGKPEVLWPLSEHAFRGDGGELTFEVEDGVATAIDFVRSSGRRTRAQRRTPR